MRDGGGGANVRAPPTHRPPPVFRRNLIRVLTIQVVSLAALWFLQARYHGRG